MNSRPAMILGWLCACLAFANVQGAGDPEAEYTRTINERARKIVDSLQLTNEVTARDVQEILVSQYRALRTIHDARDARLAAARAIAAERDRETAVRGAEEETQSAMQSLHTKFLSQLSTHLDAAQVEQVKDGLTYGVLPITYAAYMKMFPDLSGEQKAQIHSWLVEARELAMDQGSSREKHAVFGKYKGRINNYLSRAGYDLKQGERNLKP